MKEYELTPAQNRVAKEFPATVETIAHRLQISESTVRDHIAGIRQAGYEVVTASDGIRYLPSQLGMRKTHPGNRNEHSKPPKSQITRAANQHLVELNDRLCELLDKSSPPIADGGLSYDPDREDLVIHRSDDHIGEHRTDEYGNVVYDQHIAADRIRSVTEAVMETVEKAEMTGREFDTAHLLLGGDTVTGENIFNHQPHEVDLTLDKQIDLACELYMEQIERLSRRFPTVQVVCVEGNHGEIRANGMSQEANADRIVYMMLDRMVRLSELDNVTFIRSASTKFINFTTRVGYISATFKHGSDST